ncbi:hypothetical protein ADK53_07635 [Streptomyces sp. WM6373]|nr:hypothetical protein ADK53_07635 [Streptomyces sp. WM6373]KOV32916.1 hypothetical protein ADK97_21040 [Streptomyces sp. H021]
MNGLAGIAWAADALGLGTEARELLDRANRRVVAQGDPTFHHGLAGVGMTNLHFFLRGRDPRDLAAAQHCARALYDPARRDGGHAYWPAGSRARSPLTGLGSGPAGVAMFLLRMHQISGEEQYLGLGRGALAGETARASTAGAAGSPDPDLLRCSTDYLTGSAGVLRVLHRVNSGGTADFLLHEAGPP